MVDSCSREDRLKLHIGIEIIRPYYQNGIAAYMIRSGLNRNGITITKRGPTYDIMWISMITQHDKKNLKMIHM